MEPITLSLPELSDGVMIVVQGTVEKEEDGKFLLDFGRSMKTTAALHICVTFDSQIVLSLQVAKDKGFSFQRGFRRTGVLRFEVIVLVSDGNFKISLNGCHVCEAPYTKPLKEIDHLEVNGNVLLHRIFCQRPCHADLQVNGDHEASREISDTDMLGTLLLPASELPAGSEFREVRRDPESLSELERSTEFQEFNVSEAVLSGGDCFNLDLSAGDTPKAETIAPEEAGGSAQNPSIAGSPEKLESSMESKSPKTLTSVDRSELPFSYPSPQVPVSSSGPISPAGYELSQNPLMSNHLGPPYPPAQFTHSQNAVMFDQSNPRCPYPIRGNSNAPYPDHGYAYQQNPIMPGSWNAPFPLPSCTSSQNPVYPYHGYTSNLYPPLPNGSAAPYLHQAQHNPVIPSFGTQPAYNPQYPLHWPNQNNQHLGTGIARTPDWNHSNMAKFFPEGLRLNQVINIYGELLPNSSGFSVWMSNGETEHADVFLNMVVSFADRMVTRSSKKRGIWSPVETTLSHFPFQAGKRFHIAIMCYYNLFRVFSNDKPLFDFQESRNLSEITSVKIFGMVSAVNIVS